MSKPSTYTTEQWANMRSGGALPPREHDADTAAIYCVCDNWVHGPGTDHTCERCGNTFSPYNDAPLCDVRV